MSASVHAGIHTPLSRHTPPEQTHPPEQTPPPGSRLQHTVYERPVRILLECILVYFAFVENHVNCRKRQRHCSYKDGEIVGVLKRTSLKHVSSDGHQMSLAGLPVQ